MRRPRTGLIKNLSYFLNYEYFGPGYFLKIIVQPETVSTGLSYHLNPTDSLSLGLDVYRSEEDAEGNFSFSPEDSVAAGSM